MTSIFNAWNPQPVQQDPLDTLRNTLICIDGQRPLDAATARSLGRAFRQYLSGEETDLTRALGLRPGQGRPHQAPVRREALLRRDSLIREALEVLGGDSMPNRNELRRLLVTGDMVRKVSAVTELRAMHGGRLLLSEKQIGRIAKGDTAYSRRT